jgi:DNA-directed RNA polymerase subunit H (RpoH/RPB5)
VCVGEVAPESTRQAFLYVPRSSIFYLLSSQLVPKHEVLSSEEKAILLKQYNLAPDNLPRMMPEDVIARYFGLEVGQVGFFNSCAGDAKACVERGAWAAHDCIRLFFSQVVRIVRRSTTAGRYVTYRIVHTG